jgi:uncharacterized protein
VKRIVYAHGFRSASRSVKAVQLGKALRQYRSTVDFVTPNLSFDPVRAIEQLRALCDDVPADQLTVVGSSLGGFYAAVLAERYHCRAVLLNPSVRPYVTLEKHLGEQENMYTGEKFVFTRAHIQTLQALAAESSHATPRGRYLLIIETGDEVLDYREAVRHFPHARQIVIEGGDHALQSFATHIPAVLAFAGVADAA